MRSRYSAFVRGDVDYLAKTQLTPATDWDATRRWTTSLTWLGLTIVEASGEEVEFIARSLEDGAVVALHERSHFVPRDGGWAYESGTPRVTRTKVERNAPCPCGSGKKFKQCHA